MEREKEQQNEYKLLGICWYSDTIIKFLWVFFLADISTLNSRCLSKVCEGWSEKH